MKTHIDKIGLLQLFLWTAVRLLLLELIVRNIISGSPLQGVLAAGLNLAGTFVWDVFQLLPERCYLRRISPVVQSLADIMIFCACYGGQFKGLYSTVWFDSILHLIAGALIFLCGVSVIKTALDAKGESAPARLILLGAAGISALCGIGWELFEFTVDCLFDGSNTQHWQYIESELWLLPMKSRERFALMDTMGDIICNSIGLAAGAAGIKLIGLCGKKNKNKENEYV